MTTYPHLLGPAGPGLYHPAQPRADGLHARGAGRSQGRLRPHGRVLRRARRGRRGPDRDRRHCAQRPRPPDARWRAHDHRGRGRQAQAGDRRPCTRPAARSRCRSCTSAATPTTATWSRPAPCRRRSTRFSPNALSTEEVEQTIDDFVRLRRAGAIAPATTASRSWAPRAT